MNLSWPWALAALAAFPLVLAYRWWARRRRRRGALRVPSVAVIRAALPPRQPWYRRLPAALLALGMVTLAVGAARPRASVLVPSDSSSILLVIDVSSSMCSTDVAPNRLTAAEAAAKHFVQTQRSGTRIGLVEFSGIAALAVPPTTDKKALTDALGTLRTNRGTAIGLGILTAIDAIAQINPDVAPSGVTAPETPPGLGDFVPDTIVVLTDGANTQGVDPITAAHQAAARKIRIYTIGFGTTEPAPFVCDASQLDDGAFGPPGGFRGGGGFGRGGGFGGAGGNPLVINEDALQQVATITSGKYFQAKDAQQLDNTLQGLHGSIVLQHKQEELTVWFALGGALLVLAAVALSQWWHRVRSP